MLPFDNKNEFQVVVDMPEGTTLETTEAAVSSLANYLRTVPEVTNFVTFTGTASPLDFNGMVRHYYLRHGPDVGEIRVNLAKKDYRAAAEPRHPAAAAEGADENRPSPTARTSSWSNRRPARRCSPRWWPRSMESRKTATRT